MIFVTAVTNLSCLPGLIMLFKKNMILQSYFGVFTIFTSFMYHFVESIGAEKLFMTEERWH